MTIAASPTFGAAEKRALMAVAAQFWINGMVFASFVPRLPEVRDRIGVDLATIGALLAVAAAGGLVGSAITGPAIERLGTRRVMIGGALPIVFALPLIGFATAPAVFVGGLIVLQVFDVSVDVAMNIQGSELAKRLGRPIMNRLHGVWSVGTVVGSVAATQAARLGVPLTTHLLVVSAVLLATVAFVGPRLLTSDPAPDSAHTGSPVRSRRARLGNPALWRFGVIAGAAMMLELITSDWAAFRLKDDFGLADGPAGYGFVAFMVGMVIGRLGGDHVLERLGPKRLFTTAVVVSGLGLAIATLVPTTWDAGPTIAVAGYLVAGLGVSVIFPRLYDEAAQSPAGPTVMGALTAGQRITLLIAPLVVGSLAGTSLAVGTALAIVLVPSGLLLLALGRR